MPRYGGRPPAITWTSARDAILRKIIADGGKAADAAARFKIGVGAIRWRMKVLGLKGQRLRSQVMRSEGACAILRQMRAQGCSRAEIAAVLGVALPTVSNAARRLGLPLRHVNGAGNDLARDARLRIVVAQAQRTPMSLSQIAAAAGFSGHSAVREAMWRMRLEKPALSSRGGFAPPLDSLSDAQRATHRWLCRSKRFSTAEAFRIASSPHPVAAPGYAPRRQERTR